MNYSPEVVKFNSATVVFGINRVCMITLIFYGTGTNKYKATCFENRDDYAENKNGRFAGNFENYKSALEHGKTYVSQDWQED